MEITEEKVNDLKYRLIEIIQFEEQRGIKIEKKINRASGTYEIIVQGLTFAELE